MTEKETKKRTEEIVGEAEEKETVKEESPKEEIVEELPEALREKPKIQKPEKEDVPGIAYIFSSQNNTIVHITDLSGNTISRVSGGMVTKHDRLKADPTIAMFVAKRAAERAKDYGITSLYVRMRAKTGSIGIGPGAHSVVRSLGKEGFRIISILDTTRVPRGGPKKKGGKRGRRV